MDVQGGLVQEYVYSKLPSPKYTRILKLCPSLNPTDELRCTIHDYCLYDPDACLYESISYTWGPPVFSHTLVILDAAGGLRQLRITVSLHDALRKFRRCTEPRLLWADAVCINQQDVAEKSMHIPLMTDIYRGAARVLVWLGQQPDDEQLLGRVNALGRFAHVQQQNAEGRLASRHEEELRQGVMRFLCLPWFSRRWVIQEVVMNPNVVLYCGTQTTTFLHLMRSLYCVLSLSQRSSRHSRGLMTIHDLWGWWALCQIRRGSRKLHVLLEEFDYFGCADARDRVFTLAALSEDVTIRAAHVGEQSPAPAGWTDEIVVDYGLSVEVVYTWTAQMIINMGHLRWVVNQAAARSPADANTDTDTGTGLPSWVPDWRNASQFRPLALPVSYTPDCFYTNKPSLRKLASTQAYVLQAPFYCVQGGLLSSSDDNGDGDDAVSANNTIAPLAVTWRSEAFPDSDTRSDILAWMASTFAALWEQVLASLAGALSATKYAWELCVDRFGFAITGGGNLVGDLSTDDQKNLSYFCRCLENKERPENYVPGPDEPEFWDPSILEEKNIEPKSWYASNIVRRLLLDPAGQTLSASPVLDAILALIAVTMRTRCVFTCDVDKKPAHALPADALGVGNTRLRKGDRIVSVSDYGLYRSIWDSPLIVREVALLPDAVDGIVQELGYLPPAYRFVGDCFLTPRLWPLRLCASNSQDTREILKQKHVEVLDYTVVIV